jgi:alpha-tubulin suppressor-like RCC1 family protein
VPSLILLQAPRIPGDAAAAGGDDAATLEGENDIKDSEGRVIDPRVVDVSCGGGFTACVTKSGHVYTWGTWTHGRLGES